MKRMWSKGHLVCPNPILFLFVWRFSFAVYFFVFFSVFVFLQAKGEGMCVYMFSVLVEGSSLGGGYVKGFPTSQLVLHILDIVLCSKCVILLCVWPLFLQPTACLLLYFLL